MTPSSPSLTISPTSLVWNTLAESIVIAIHRSDKRGNCSFIVESTQSLTSTLTILQFSTLASHSDNVAFESVLVRRYSLAAENPLTTCSTERESSLSSGPTGARMRIIPVLTLVLTALLLAPLLLLLPLLLPLLLVPSYCVRDLTSLFSTTRSVSRPSSMSSCTRSLDTLSKKGLPTRDRQGLRALTNCDIN